MIFSDYPLKVFLDVSANSGFNNSLFSNHLLASSSYQSSFLFVVSFVGVLIFLFSSSLDGGFLRFVNVFGEGSDIGVDSSSAVTVFTFIDLYPSTSSSGAFLFTGGFLLIVGSLSQMGDRKVKALRQALVFFESGIKNHSV